MLLIKIAGAAVLTAAGGYVAAALSRQEKRRAQLFRELAEGAAALHSEACFSRRPVAEILDSLKEKPVTGAFFKQLAEKVRAASGRPLEQLMEEELQRLAAANLADVGAMAPLLAGARFLEGSDLGATAGQLARAEEALLKESERLLGLYRQKHKLHRSVGLVAGLFAALLLI